MKSVRSFFLALLLPGLYLLGSAAVAALVAYPVFRFMGSDNVSDFRSLVSRGGQAVMLLGLWPLARRVRLTGSDLGFCTAWFKQWWIGFVIGAFMLAILVLLLVLLDVRQIVGSRWVPDQLLPITLKALGIGFAVALMEETLFRGALLAFVRKMSGPLAAALVSAFYFACLHFIGTKWTTPLDQVGWDTGFRIALDGFYHIREAAPDVFLGLFLAGLLLASVRILFSGSLGICMGIHAGWVFIIKSSKPLTYMVPTSPFAFLVGNYDQFVGYLSSLWLGLLLVLLLWLCRDRFAVGDSHES